ncbi:MAG: phenylalanine--tRNA ligase subunit beta [Patescibacteria group bacterium]
MKYSYRWLSSLVKNIPKPEVLAELLTMHSYQVESIEKIGNDWVLDIDVLPNRMPDSAGHIGVAREISVLIKKPLTLPKIDRTVGMKLPKNILSLAVAPKGTARYIASYIEGVSVKDSPLVIRERLTMCGMRPINNIVDATNYVLLESGHPVHAFDYDKIVGKKIEVRFAKKGERITLLDGQVIILMPKHLVIADGEGPLALAGIKGGSRAEVTKDTKQVVLETAVFDPILIRQTSRELGITTDASSRFVQGLPYAELNVVALRLRDLICDIARGKMIGFSDISLVKSSKQPTVTLRVEYLERLLGVRVSEKEVADILERLGCRVSKKKVGVFLVTAPSWRTDLVQEEDLIEEVGRIFGYERITSKPPHAPLVHPHEHSRRAVADEVGRFLASNGFYEVLNYSFASAKDGDLELANSLTTEFTHMRASISSGLLKSVATNLPYERELRLFEVGNVFRKAKKSPEEKVVLGVVLTTAKKTADLFYEAKGTVESVLESLGVTDILFEDIGDHVVEWPYSQKKLIHPYRSVFVRKDNKTLGVLYEVHPDAELKIPAVIIELALDIVDIVVEEEVAFQEIPKYPMVVRDLAILVSTNDRVEDVTSTIEGAGGAFLADTDLFDYYEGDTIGAGKKSLAFHLIFQSQDRTLTDEEVVRFVADIIAALRKEGWEVRS